MGLLDPNDLLALGYTDTIQITAYSIPEDSVDTYKMPYALIGSMYDPIFGVTTATFYSQIRLSKSSTRFGTAPVFDSAYLYLPYLGSYGDTISNMTFTVYQLTESMLDSSYYSNATLPYDEAKPLGQITFQPKPNDSAYYDGEKQGTILRIPITNNFGDAIFSITDTTYLNDNTKFVEKFYGICIVATPQTTSGKGCILNFSLSSGLSELKMYYHNTDDTTSYSFYLNTSAKSFNNYNHNNYAEAIPNLREQIVNHNISPGQQFLFAQGLGGVKIKIEFPGLNKWADSQKTVINDAQLIFGNASVSDIFSAPGQITLRGVGEAGTTSPDKIIDESSIGAGHFDGFYNESANSYRFRLTRYIQQVIIGKANDNGLHLIIPGSSYYGARLVLNGTSSIKPDLKLYVRYTKVD